MCPRCVVYLVYSLPYAVYFTLLATATLAILQKPLYLCPYVQMCVAAALSMKSISEAVFNHAAELLPLHCTAEGQQTTKTMAAALLHQQLSSRPAGHLATSGTLGRRKTLRKLWASQPSSTGFGRWAASSLQGLKALQQLQLHLVLSSWPTQLKEGMQHCWYGMEQR